MSSTWRLATPDDDHVLVALSQALYREDPSPLRPGETQTYATLRRFRDEPTRGRAVVLEVEGDRLGYALLASFWSNEYGGEICVVDEFYVAAEARGRGEGRRLLEDLRRGSALWAPKPVALMLEVTPSNARARTFYESFGFAEKKNAHLLLRL